MRAHMDTRTGIFDTEPAMPETCLWETRTSRFTSTQCAAPAADLFCTFHDDDTLPGYDDQLDAALDWAPHDPFTDD